ncbi:MAG: galactokinase [Spirochaetes bacterium]|nr:galactokinase [Spirochaetota bacterium]
MNQLQTIHAIERGAFDSLFASLYPNEALISCKNRYVSLLEQHRKRFGLKEVWLVSSPGRTELGGNHTDHNHGKVLAAAVHLDAIAVGSYYHDSYTDTPWVELYSEGFPEIRLALEDLSPKKEEEGRTEGLVRGLLSGFARKGFPPLRGFQAVIQSRVLSGSGLSSSAAIELLLGTLFNTLFAKGTLTPIELALLGKEAENRFFGKPCGLMDQLTCAYGGVCCIDFENSQSPEVEHVPFSLPGYQLFLIDTGSSHADLTDEYASIPLEMQQVARLFGGTVLRNVPKETFFSQIPTIKGKVSDRAILRALHFYRENERVVGMTKALKEGKTESFLSLVKESGLSSWTLLQNCVSNRDPTVQQIPLALEWAKEFIGERGAVRVHGGGFAGTIQAYVLCEQGDTFVSHMERLLGKGSVLPLQIRPWGARLISSLELGPGAG